MIRAYPLPLLPDMRRAYITSQFKTRNPSRPTHNGVDLFYRWRQSDGMVKMGDGGATRDRDNPGMPKWFIPEGTKAIAAADGIVQIVGEIRTGWRLWIAHADGTRSGYFHLRSVDVSPGAEVSLGHPLGEVGDNPRAIDAEHLHFEISPAGSYAPMDPEVWLKGAFHFIPS